MARRIVGIVRTDGRADIHSCTDHVADGGVGGWGIKAIAIRRQQLGDARRETSLSKDRRHWSARPKPKQGGVILWCFHVLGCGDGGVIGPGTLVVEEKEDLVFDDRAAESAGELA